MASRSIGFSAVLSALDADCDPWNWRMPLAAESSTGSNGAPRNICRLLVIEYAAPLSGGVPVPAACASKARRMRPNTPVLPLVDCGKSVCEPCVCRL